MLEPFFQWMNDLAVSKAIGESIWIYPLVQAIHLLFLALFAGSLLICVSWAGACVSSRSPRWRATRGRG